MPSVCIAQACCESAYGTSLKMVRANALFAIKNGGYATSPTYVGTIMCIINKYNLMQYDAESASRSVLRMGAWGEQVKELQTLLAKEGHPLTVDGIFGAKTLEAVKAFQAERGLAVDGVVGSATWNMLN